jgi:hypothetical protein
MHAEANAANASTAGITATNHNSSTNSAVVDDSNSNGSNNGSSRLPVCPTCDGPTRCNVSHMPDAPHDLDMTVKGANALSFKKWLYDQRIFCESHNTNINSINNNAVQKVKRVTKRAKRTTNDAKQHQQQHFVILEIGCGESEHSLRPDAHYLHACNSGNATLIRIDPLLSLNQSTNSNSIVGDGNTIILNESASVAIQTLFSLVKQRVPI